MLLRFLRGTVGLTMLVVGLSVALGGVAAVLGDGHLKFAILICALPLLPVLVLRTQVAAVAAMACLPFEINLLGSLGAGVNVAPSDLMLSAALAGLLLAVNADSDLRRRLSVLRPVIPLVAIYFAAAVVVTVGDPSLSGVIALIQRIEVVCVPMLLGAVVLTTQNARRGMIVFVIAAFLLGLGFILPHATAGAFGVQKNPAGQYIVDAALILLAAFGAHRVRFLVIPVLVLMAYTTQSRGAMIGLAAALIVFVVLRSRGPVGALARAVPLAALMLVTFLLLPASWQDRLLGNTLNDAHNDAIRKAYIADAWQTFRQHPIIGVGTGNYLAGSAGAGGTLTNDPHSILLLEAAEGGLLLVLAFLMLQIGALVIVVRRVRQSPWAIPAICVQVAILVHAQVDVYWVRGTPDIGWLLIGLALAPLGKSAGSGGPAREPEAELAPADGRLML